jgi:hydrogenase/urease accessory protein HupE
MKIFCSRLVAPFAVFLATAAFAQAHPGHDGHDFTWDFGHLAAHPDATILCVGVLGVIAWGTWKVFAAAPDAPKSEPVRADDERRAR